jgi:hypothetical protein
MFGSFVAELFPVEGGPRVRAPATTPAAWPAPWRRNIGVPAMPGIGIGLALSLTSAFSCWRLRSRSRCPIAGQPLDA